MHKLAENWLRSDHRASHDLQKSTCYSFFVDCCSDLGRITYKVTECTKIKFIEGRSGYRFYLIFECCRLTILTCHELEREHILNYAEPLLQQFGQLISQFDVNIYQLNFKTIL